MYVLGIDTSCDDTSVAILDSESGSVLAEHVSSQVELHSIYGGVVPEIAARKHLEYIIPMIEKALDSAGIAPDPGVIDLVAATRGPGLIGGLLIGFSAAKALSLGWEIPFVGVNHINGHLVSAELDHGGLPYPHIALVISGGHSELYKAESPIKYSLIGQTRDDAVGELLDKVGRLLDLPFPSGPIIDKWAVNLPQLSPRPEFPRPLLSDEVLEFSFSGLKTACLYFLRSDEAKKFSRESIGSEVLYAAVDCLLGKSFEACKKFGLNYLVISGGVAASEYLRKTASQLGAREGLDIVFPSRKHCTDNGSMIALAGHYKFTGFGADPYDLDCDASLDVN
jgi:N6-L-threonylcarbamoyladenine synthase